MQRFYFCVHNIGPLSYTNIRFACHNLILASCTFLNVFGFSFQTKPHLFDGKTALRNCMQHCLARTVSGTLTRMANVEINLIHVCFLLLARVVGRGDQVSCFGLWERVKQLPERNVSTEMLFLLVYNALVHNFNVILICVHF